MARECNCGTWDSPSPFRHAVDCPVFIAGHRPEGGRYWYVCPKGCGKKFQTADELVGHVDGCPVDARRPVKFSVGDVVRTKNGANGRVVCVDRAGGQPVLALIREADGSESARAYEANGTSVFPMAGAPFSQRNIGTDDLLPAPRRATVWVGMQKFDGRKDPVAHVYRYKRPHNVEVDGDGMACLIRVELEEGRFDE